MSEQSNADEYPRLGDRVTYVTDDGQTRRGTVVKRVTVGDLRSYDVISGEGMPAIVAPRQIVGHPLYDETQKNPSASGLRQVS